MEISSSSNVWFFTDMEVDWDKGIAFISSVGDGGEGVCYIPLKKIRSGSSNLICKPFNKDLPTRLVRNLLLANDYLFAGTWWASVWRANSSVEVRGDINGDYVVDVTDLVSLVNALNTANAKADINCDGEVSVLDIVELINIILSGN